MVLSRASKLARWLATAWLTWPRCEAVCALAWASAASRCCERGDGDVVGGLLGVEVLLGDQLVVVERLGAVVVELLLLEVGLGLRRCWPGRSSRRRCRS